MPKRQDLPRHLRGIPFTNRAARDAGVTPDRLRSTDLDSPFHGVHLARPSQRSLLALSRAYAAKMPESAAFSHVTAARLWGMPLPLGLDLMTDVHVAVEITRTAPSGRSVVGHRARFGDGDVRIRRGVRVLSPAMTWCHLAEMLDVYDLVAAGEYAITGNPYEQVLPVCSMDELHAAHLVRGRSRGSARRSLALGMMREGPLSRTETLLRLACVAVGLPEPRINEWARDAAGNDIALVDLGWFEYRVAVEYQGDGHRGVKQFRHDIHRRERLIDHKWTVVLVSAADLFDRPIETVRRIESRLRDAGWRGKPIEIAQIGKFGR